MTPHGLSAAVRHLRQLVTPRPAPGADRDLLDRFLATGDEAAFAALVARYGPLVRGVARRVLGDAHAADDVFQATFLVLARRAASIRRRSAVGSWLYGVAYRLARQVRTREARRQKREARAVPPVADAPGSPDPCANAAWADLLTVLDEELQRLPERLRAPLLLCYYEGCTQDDAARRLGWSFGTLRRRLDRGRALLRARLTRRGATLGAGLFATALAPQAATAVVPAALARTTVEAALAFAAGREVAEPITTLAEEGLRMLGTSKLKAVAAMAVLVGGLAGGVAALPGTVPDDKPQEPPAPPVAARPDVPLPAGAVLRHGEPNFRHGGDVINLFVTPDGKTLLTQGRRSVRFWDYASGRDQGGLNLPDDGPDFWTGSLTPDGRTLLTTRHNGTAQVWDLAGRRLVRSFRLAEPPFDVTAARCTHSPDGRMIAVVTADGSLRVCDVTQGRELDQLRTHSDGVKVATFAVDSKTLLLSCDDRSIRVWDVATGQDTGNRWRQSPPNITNAVLSPDGQRLAEAAPRDNPQPGQPPPEPTLQLWNLRGPSSINLRNPSLASDLMTFTPDSRYLLAPGEQSEGRILFQWDVRTGRNMRQYPEHHDRINALAFTPDGKTLITSDVALRFWDWNTGREQRAASNAPRLDRAYALAPDGRFVAETDDAGGVRLWDAGTGQELRRFEAPRPAPGATVRLGALAVSPDGRVVAAGGRMHFEDELETRPQGRGHVWLWDATTGQLLHRLSDTTVDSRLVFSPDSRTIVSVGPDRPCVFWDVVDGREWSDRPVLGADVVAFTPSNRWMVQFRSDGLTRTDLETRGSNHFRLTGRRDLKHSAVAFSPDGSRLAFNGFVANEPGAVWVYDTVNGRLIRQFWDIKRRVASLALSPDGRVLATAPADEGRPISVWDVETGNELKQFRGLPGRATWLAFAPDGRRLFSASTDTTVLVWDTSDLRPAMD
jgi:RNA polymerase sigma factor (sigma-70 family)